MTYLFHFSEDPTITVFEPRVAPTQQIEGAWVWADDEANSPRYWFPRDCPRATWWRTDGSGHRIHAIQWGWFERFCTCVLYRYRLDASPFHKVPGGWKTGETVRPLGVERVGPLLDKHRDAGIELRLVVDLRALWNEVIQLPDVGFSGIRLATL